MTFSFRIKLQFPGTFRISSDEARLVIAIDPYEIVLKTSNGEVPFKESQILTLNGSGFETEEDAFIVGNEWVSAVQIAFAELKIGADFGERTLSGGVGQAARDAIRELHGIELMAEPNRLTVFRSDSDIVYLSGSASVSTGRQLPDIHQAIIRAKQDGLVLNEKQRLAFHLYSAAHFESNPDSRLMILTMAIETLIVPQRHREATTKHLDELILATKNSNLDPETIQVLCSGISNLKRESINRAGRSLVSILSGQLYGDNESPEDFFSRIYKIRSNLAHGNFPRPDVMEVRMCAAHLEQFVADLIRKLAEPEARNK